MCISLLLLISQALILLQILVQALNGLQRSGAFDPRVGMFAGMWIIKGERCFQAQHAAHVFQCDLLPAPCFSQPGNEKFISKLGGEVWSVVTHALGTNSILFSTDDFQRNKIDISYISFCLLFWEGFFFFQFPLWALLELSGPSLQQQYCSWEELLQLLPSNGKIQPPRPQLFILESDKTISCTILLPLGQAVSSMCNPSIFRQNKSWSDGWLYMGKCCRSSRKFLSWSDWNGASLIMDQICKVHLDFYYF